MICEWEAVVKSDGMQKQSIAIRFGLCRCFTFRRILQRKLWDGEAKVARLNGIVRASNHFRNRSKGVILGVRPMLTGPKEKKCITGAISGFDWVERCWDGRGLEQTLIMMLILLVSE